MISFSLLRASVATFAALITLSGGCIRKGTCFQPGFFRFAIPEIAEISINIRQRRIKSERKKLNGNKLLMISSETFKDVRTLKGNDLPLQLRIEKKEEIRAKEEAQRRKHMEQNK